MDVSVTYVISYVVATIATFILAVYFSREYYRKRLRASISWAVAFSLYCVLFLIELSITVFGEAEVGRPALLFGLLVVDFAMATAYYGASQLFFSPGSFFREKMTVLIFLVYLLIFSILSIRVPVEGFRDAVAPYASPWTISFIIAILFFRVFQRLAVGDFRRRIVLLVSTGWFLGAIDAFYRGFIKAAMKNPIGDTVTNIIVVIAWILILYGMTIGKAART